MGDRRDELLKYATPADSPRRERLLEYVTPPAAPVMSPSDYAPAPRTGLGRAGQEYAASTPYMADAEARLAWDRVRDDLITNGMEPEDAEREATRAVKSLQAIGNVEDEESVRDALEAYEGPLTADKVYAQITNRVYPMGPNRPAPDDEFKERAAAYSAMGAGEAMDVLDEHLSGEPMSDEDAKRLGLDKEWARKARSFARKAILAPASPLATAVVAMGGVSPYVPTFSDIGGLGQDALDILGGYAADPDVQALTGGDDTFPVAAGLQKALGRGLVVNTPIADALPLIVDAGVASYDLATGDTLAEKIKAAHDGRGLGDLVGEHVDDMRRADAFDPAAKMYYETGDDSALERLTDEQIPRNVPRVRPNIAMLRSQLDVLADEPEAAEFRKAAESGASDAALQTLADRLPLSVVRRAQPDAGPTRDDVVAAFRRRTLAQEDSGAPEIDAIGRIAGSALLRPDVAGGEKVFVPSVTQKLMSLANIAQPVIMEADIPIPSAWLVGKGLSALGVERLGRQLENIRVPTPAGIESMLESGAWNEELQKYGLLGSSAPTQRDDRASYTGNVLATLAMPEYQTFGTQRIGRRQGVREGSTADAALGTLDVGADFLFPWEEVALGPAALATTAARRAWVGSKAARVLGGSDSAARRAAFDAATASDPLAALSSALDEGFREDIRAGRRVFKTGDQPGTMDFRFQTELEQQLRNAGINPETAFALANDVADANKRAGDRTVRAWMAKGAPQDVELRATPEYKALRDQYAAMFPPKDVDTVMALNEQAAWQAVGDGTIAKPEEWFALQRVEKGGVPGAGAYFSRQPLSPEAQEGARYAREKVAALDPEGKNPVGAWRQVLDEMTSTRLDKMTERDKGIRAASRGEDFVSMPTRRAKAASALPEYVEPFPELKAAAEQASRAWSEARAKVVAEGGDPFKSWQYPELDAAETAAYDAEKRLRLARAEKAEREGRRFYSEEGGTVRGSIEPISPTDTPAFKQWFGGSKVVDAEGKPLVVNHATTESFDTFDMSRSNGVAGAGAYFTDGPPMDNYGGTVIPAYLSVQNPIDLRGGDSVIFSKQKELLGTNMQEARSWPQMQKMSKDFKAALMEKGHDGVMLSGERPGETYYVAFSPEQIKSATANVGTFDPKNPSILHSRTGPTIHGSIEPDQAKWLLRYFETASPDTLLHENAHLIRFVLGDKWMDELATFFDHTTVNGQKQLTVKGEEQFAEAMTRVLRGQLAPRGRLGVYLSELKDALSDLWRRVRNQPVTLPPGFRQWWDAKLDPAASLRTLVSVTDERIPRPLSGVGVTVDPDTRKVIDLDEYLRREQVKNAGQVRGYMDMDLTPGQTQRMFGLGRTQAQADAIDVLAKGIAALGTAEAQRHWGFSGDMVRVTPRTSVPAVRKAAVLDRARGVMERAMGGTPASLDALTDKQAAGLADHVAHLVDAGFTSQLPRELLSPTRDFRSVTEAEYRAIVDATVDDVAGPGAIRDRRSEAMAGNLATSLLAAASKQADAIPYLKIARGRMAELFDSTFPISANLNPAAAEVVERARRRFGQIPADVVRAIAEVKAGKPGAMSEEMIRMIAAGIPRLGAAPEDVDDLVRLTAAIGVDTTADDLIAAADEIAHQFSANPAHSQFQRASEDEAVRVLRAAKRSGVAPDPTTLQNAASVVQVGLHRRSEAVKNTGLKILQAFMGKPELKHAVEDPTIASDIYKKWYEGDWKGASELIGDRGGATDPLSNYDPIAASLAAVTQLIGDGAMARFGAELMEIGLPIHTDAVNLAGRDYARWVPLADSTHTGEEYRKIVHQYMNAILTFGAHEKKLFAPDGTYVGRQQLPSQLQADGTVNLAAWQDAHRILNAWGIKDGTAKMERLILPTGEEMWVPDVVQAELSGLFERTAKAGLAWTQAAEGVPEEMLGRFGKHTPGTTDATVNPDRAIRGTWLHQNINKAIGVLVNGWNTSWGLARVGVTTGVALPNPQFYMGNLSSGVVQLYQRKGAVGTARALGRYLAPTQSGAVLRSVYARMWGDSRGYYKPASASLVDRAGRVMSDQWVTREALAAGLHSSQPKAESAIKLIDDIRRNEGTFWTRIRRDGMWGGVKEGFRYWQGILTDASAAVDDLYRVAAFVDELAEGASSAEAAAVARSASFDYNDLTEFEKQWVRRTIMFYTYQRRNTDLFWWTMINHPSRIMGQFRAIRDAQRIAFGDDETAEKVLPTHLDGRIIVGVNEAIGDEEAIKSTMGIALLLPQAPAVDHLSLWADIFRAMDEDSTGRRELLARTTPEVQFLITMGTDMDIFSGRDLAAFNTVPSWMVEMDRQLNGGIIVDDLFRVRKTQNRDPAMDAVPGEDRWEPTGPGAKWWWIFRNNLQVPPFGRGMDTITQLSRGDWLVSGAVNNARWYRQATGLTGAVRDEVVDPLLTGVVRPAMDVLPGVDTSNEPVYERATEGPTETPRAGFDAATERGQLFGLKAVAIPTEDVAEDKAERDRLRRAKEMGGEERRRDPYRYGR